MMSIRKRTKEHLFLNRTHFTILFDSVLYKCKTILKCKKYLQCGKTWSILLIWQHCSDDVRTYSLYVYEDGVIAVESCHDLTFLQCFFAYMHQFNGTCYADKYFLAKHIHSDNSVLHFIIYLHMYKTYFRFNVESVPQTFTW
jgi:hypothetical protein